MDRLVRRNDSVYSPVFVHGSVSIAVPGYENWDVFTHEALGGDGYAASEGSTGFSVSGNGDGYPTRERAEMAAVANFGRQERHVALGWRAYWQEQLGQSLTLVVSPQKPIFPSAAVCTKEGDDQ